MANEKILSSETQDGEKMKGPPKARVFCLVLQADEPKQVYALTQILKYPQLYRAVYILHDQDRVSSKDVEDAEKDYTESDLGKLKPPHYHVCIRTPTPSTAQVLSNRLGVHVMRCSDEFGYILYMLHDTWECEQEREFKKLYNIVDLKGDSQRISMLMQQNGHFVQLQHLMDYLDQGLTIRSTVSALSALNETAVIDALMSDNAVRSIWLQAQRQEENILRLKQCMDEVKSEIKEEL